MESEKKEIPEINFIEFVMMLTMTGLYQLGKAPHPETGQFCRDLNQAKQTINLLTILEEKTKNNLTKEEEETLMSGLTSLRLAYAEEVKKEN